PGPPRPYRAFGGEGFPGPGAEPRPPLRAPRPQGGAAGRPARPPPRTGAPGRRARRPAGRGGGRARAGVRGRVGGAAGAGPGYAGRAQGAGGQGPGLAAGGRRRRLRPGRDGGGGGLAAWGGAGPGRGATGGSAGESPRLGGAPSCGRGTRALAAPGDCAGAGEEGADLAAAGGPPQRTAFPSALAVAVGQRLLDEQPWGRLLPHLLSRALGRYQFG